MLNKYKKWVIPIKTQKLIIIFFYGNIESNDNSCEGININDKEIDKISLSDFRNIISKNITNFIDPS